MKKMIKVLGILFFFSFISKAQLGELRGTISDSLTGKGIWFANVELTLGDTYTGLGAITDSTGAFQITAINPGKYVLTASDLNYQKRKIEVVITSGSFTELNVELSQGSNEITEVVIETYTEPLYKKDAPTENIITIEERKHSPMAHADVSTMAATMDSNIKQDESTGAIFIRGSRSENTMYVVDGIKMTEGAMIPASAIQEVRIITSGIPAEFGDVTGGIIYITTRSYSPAG